MARIPRIFDLVKQGKRINEVDEVIPKPKYPFGNLIIKNDDEIRASTDAYRKQLEIDNDITKQMSGFKKSVEEPPTVGVPVPGTKKLIADNKTIPVRFKKTILGTEGRLSLKDTEGEKIFRNQYKNSKVRGEENIKTGAAFAGATAITGTAAIALLIDQRNKSNDKEEIAKLTKSIDDGLLEIKQNELDAEKLENAPGVKVSLIPPTGLMSKQ